MQSIFDERLWLAWLVKVRIIVLTVLLGIELAIARLTTNPFPLRLFIGIMVLWYAVSIFYLLLLSLWQERRIQSLLQVITDLIMVTLVVYATGGVDSSLNFFYPLVITVACILLPRIWAYLTGALAFILYVTVLELTYFASHSFVFDTHPGLGALQAIIFVNLFGYLAVAYLAGLLAAKLRQVDVKLKYTSGALEDLQALHENIIQSISGGLITTGLDGYITLANAAAQKLFERSEKEFLGQAVGQLFLDPLPSRGFGTRPWGSALCGGKRLLQDPAGMATVLAVPGRKTIGYVYTFDDLTQIRRLERDLRIQDRLAAVGRLAAAIAHEIRNPLTSIAGSVSMLSGIVDLSEEHRQLLQIVTRESERLNGIITDFLVYSRGKQYQFASVDLLPLLEDTLTLLENRLMTENAGIRIERHFGFKQALTIADGDKIKQVFWNFCQNAVRAMSAGGVLRVSVEQVGEDWQINFADTGPGMNRQLVEKIFEPFQSQFEGGTGLGLAIVYQIVQAHEGKVWARSKIGEGSVFVLRLRRAAVAEDMLAKLPVANAKLLPQDGDAVAAATGTGGRAHG